MRTTKMKALRWLLLITPLLHGAITPLATAADWPQWRGPNRDGISAETGWSTQWPSSGPKRLWKLNVGTGCSTVSVVGERVFTMGNKDNQDTVVALDAKTGAVIWKHSYTCELDPHQFEGGPGGTPTVDGTAVYTLSRDGQLNALRADNGQPIWTKNIEKEFGTKAPTWGYAASPMIVGNSLMVDVGGDGASTVAFDKQTGHVLWKSGNDKVTYATPVPFPFSGRNCVASFNAFGLVVRELAGGKELARHPWKTSYDVNAATPLVSANHFFISSGYSKGCALLELKDSGFNVIWQNKNMRNHMNSSVLWKGRIYGFDESTLTCLDLATGNVVWLEKGLGKGSLMIADGKLIALGDQGELVIADTAAPNYKPLAHAKVLDGHCWVVPVLANGKLYCKTNTGDLVCLDLAAH